MSSSLPSAARNDMRGFMAELNALHIRWHAELEMAHGRGDVDRELVCKYYIMQIDAAFGLSLILAPTDSPAH